MSAKNRKKCQNFLLDQRSLRKMAIEPGNVNVSKKLRICEDRKASRLSKDDLQVSPVFPEEGDISLNSTGSDCCQSGDEDEGKGYGPSGELSLNMPRK